MNSSKEKTIINKAYILGAGASIHAMPLVKEIKQRMAFFALNLALREYELYVASENNSNRCTDIIDLIYSHFIEDKNEDNTIDIFFSDKWQSIASAPSTSEAEERKQEYDRLKFIFYCYFIWEEFPLDDDYKFLYFTYKLPPYPADTLNLESLKKSIDNIKFQSSTRLAKSSKKLAQSSKKLAQLSMQLATVCANQKGELFFLEESTKKKKLDERYSVFITELNNLDEGSDYILLSWNYDSQFIKNLEGKEIANNAQLLSSIKNKEYKLNGSIYIEKLEDNIPGVSKDSEDGIYNDRLLYGLLDMILNSYTLYHPGRKSVTNQTTTIIDHFANFVFSWEKVNSEENNSQATYSVTKRLFINNDLTYVKKIIVIGYSFPVLNRNIDRAIFEKILSNLINIVNENARGHQNGTDFISHMDRHSDIYIFDIIIQCPEEIEYQSIQNRINKLIKSIIDGKMGSIAAYKYFLSLINYEHHAKTTQFEC